MFRSSVHTWSVGRHHHELVDVGARAAQVVQLESDLPSLAAPRTCSRRPAIRLPTAGSAPARCSAPPRAPRGGRLRVGAAAPTPRQGLSRVVESASPTPRQGRSRVVESAPAAARRPLLRSERKRTRRAYCLATRDSGQIGLGFEHASACSAPRWGANGPIRVGAGRSAWAMASISLKSRPSVGVFFQRRHPQ